MIILENSGHDLISSVRVKEDCDIYRRLEFRNGIIEWRRLSPGDDLTKEKIDTLEQTYQTIKNEN